jgi:Family of unknown function (DUF5906)
MKASASDTSWWAKCPTLESYRRRIGAEITSLRRAVIKAEREDGYWYETASITIKNGQVDVYIMKGAANAKELAEGLSPTDDEKRAIAVEIAAVNFPRSINARKGQLPPELKNVDPQHYSVFHDLSGKEILFIQWRENGEKPDWPFTFWSDHKWRMLEPDGLLPLYGLEQLNDAYLVFVHEGATAARKVAARLAAGGGAVADFPWDSTLKLGTHIGWPGGATNAHRVDWSPLKKRPNLQIVVVADNDQAGVEAVATISQILLRTMEVIKFDDRFKVGFDLANEWPANKEWWRGLLYVGPTYDDCLFSATWATDAIRSGGQGAPPHKVRGQFAKEWFWIEDPAVYVRRSQPDKLLSEEVFNRSVRPFSHVANTARLLIQHESSKCSGVTYDPGHMPGKVNIDGRLVINVYRPPTIPAKEGDPKTFLDFTEHLIPEKNDRIEFLRWAATLIARPEIRMTYGVLLISETQGVGKGTMGEAIIAPLVGEHNVSVPSEKEIVDNNYNYWLAHKRLAVVHEIYSGHSVKAYNILKSTISDKFVTIRLKFLPNYMLENWIHIFACSNSMRALHIEESDRRWLVPRVTEMTQPHKYWVDLHQWLAAGGLEIVRWWADDFLQTHDPVQRGVDAPSTGLKKEIILETRSEGSQLAYDLGLLILEKHKGEKIVLAMENVRDWVAGQRKMDRNDRRLEKALTLRKALKAAGMHEPQREVGKEDRRFYYTKHRKSHLVANFSIGLEVEWNAIKEFYRDAKDLWPF